jgi:glycosyltransferase involved in cell wall biosynthesis
MTSFSVIVPVFNGEATIERCIQSITNQSCGDFEIIVVDDGSTDDTRKRVAALLDSRIKLISRPANLGPAACRNAGLAAARGEFVVFMDADDWLDENFLLAVAQTVEGRECIDYVITRYRLVSETGELLDAQAPDLAKPLESFLHDRIVSSVWAKAFRAKHIRENAIRFPDIRFMEDSAFNTQFLLAMKPGAAAFSDKALYHYSKLQPSATKRLFEAHDVRRIEQGIAETDKLLSAASYPNLGLVAARAIRMLLLYGIFRLSADFRSDRSTAFARPFRTHMIRRFPPGHIIRQSDLRPKDKLLALMFYTAPRLTVHLLSKRLP